MMDKLNCESKRALKQKRREQMVESMTDMRTAEHSDIFLVCQDKEFCVHELVLKTCSPYFVALFHSGLQEVSSGQITFNNMEPNILQLILNYIYTGEIQMETDDEVKKVLAASHMMQLDDLHQFCCESLSRLIVIENCVDVWETASMYDSPSLRKNVLEFCLDKANQLRCADAIMQCEPQMLKELLHFSTVKYSCQDNLLISLINWLRFNWQHRKALIDELFAAIEPKLVSEDCMRSLLKNTEIMSWTPLPEKLNALGVEVFLFSSDVVKRERKEPFQFHVKNVSELQGTRYSKSKVMHNLTWQIKIKITAVGAKKSFGVYIHCSNHNSKASNWSCSAITDFILLKQNKEGDNFTRRLRNTFRATADMCGFEKFIPFAIMQNPECNFIKNDGITIEVRISAATPSDLD